MDGVFKSKWALTGVGGACWAFGAVKNCLFGVMIELVRYMLRKAIFVKKGRGFAKIYHWNSKAHPDQDANLLL